MFGKKHIEDEEHSFWISYADMLIGLLISFMVIAILLYKEKPAEPCPPVDPTLCGQLQQMVKEFKDTFSNDPTIEVTDRGTVRFRILNGQGQLFHLNSNQPTPFLISKLNDFVPKYLSIVNKNRLKNGLEIREIRIEGHTDTVGMQKMRRREVLYNYRLSAERAAEVQRYLFYHPSFDAQIYDDKKYFFDHIINCGYGTSQPLDKDGELVSKTGNPIDIDQSRRIEFRIITSDQANVIKKANPNEKSILK